MVVPAGDFGAWLAETREAAASDGYVDVPCNGCTVCCESWMYVRVTEGDAAALAVIPPELIVQPHDRPSGHLVIRTDDGRCPLLAATGCSIHAERPRNCRVYDCRLLAATGQPAGGPSQARVTARMSEWEFTFADDVAKVQAQALLAAGQYVTESGVLPDFPRGRALLALAIHESFMTVDAAGVPRVIDASPSLDYLSMCLPGNSISSRGGKGGNGGSAGPSSPPTADSISSSVTGTA